MRVWIISLIREIEDRCSAWKGVSASLKECRVTSQSPFVGAVRILPLIKIQTQTVKLPTYLQAFWNSISPLSLDVSVFGNLPTKQPTFITVKKKPFCRKMAVMLSFFLLGWYLGEKMNYTGSSLRTISCRYRRFVIYGSFFSTRGFNALGDAWWESWLIHRKLQVETLISQSWILWLYQNKKRRKYFSVQRGYSEIFLF